MASGFTRRGRAFLLLTEDKIETMLESFFCPMVLKPTGKRNAGGGGSDRNINGGMGGESDYDKGCGTGNGNRKSGGYGGGGCGTYGNGGDGTVLIRYWAYEE